MVWFTVVDEYHKKHTNWFPHKIVESILTSRIRARIMGSSHNNFVLREGLLGATVLLLKANRLGHLNDGGQMP